MVNAPLESQEQRTLFQWLALNMGRHPELGLCFHIPNGGSRNAREAHNLKLQGVKAGVPDLFLPVPHGEYHGLFIEMKRTKGGRVSDEQKEWITALSGQGYKCVVTKGWEDAAEQIKAYISA